MGAARYARWIRRGAIQHDDDGHTWQAVWPPDRTGFGSLLFFCTRCPATETLEARRARIARLRVSQMFPSAAAGAEIALTRTETRLLHLFQRTDRSVVTLEVIARELWPAGDLDTHLRAAIRSLVHTLRTKALVAGIVIDSLPDGYRIRTSAPGR
jgi:DNA-binding response OmpR family regulator